MLVLNRRPGEALQLGGGIRIVVLSSDRGGVRLGIDAPLAVSILREELVEAVATANRDALAPGTASWAASVAPLAQLPATARGAGLAPNARSDRQDGGG
ncbi:MAG: carbon storage regulator [Gemmatimonadales bacterium]|nr:carbon storage regulator [Gemmatimonadales bacterium]